MKASRFRARDSGISASRRRWPSETAECRTRPPAWSRDRLRPSERGTRNWRRVIGSMGTAASILSSNSSKPAPVTAEVKIGLLVAAVGFLQDGEIFLAETVCLVEDVQARAIRHAQVFEHLEDFGVLFGVKGTGNVAT